MVAVTHSGTMKFACAVLSFAASIAVCAALVAPTQQDGPGVLCYSDENCKVWLGGHCFCLKPNYATKGNCKCNMDPKYLNECLDDDDCINNPYLDQTRKRCECEREYYSQPKGQCKCYDALG